MLGPAVGTLVKIKGPGWFVEVIGPKTRKATGMPQLFRVEDGGVMKIYSRQEPDYLEQLAKAPTLEVPGATFR